MVPIWLSAAALALGVQAGQDPVTLHGIGPLRIGLDAQTLSRRFGATREEGYDAGDECSYWSSRTFPGLHMMVVNGRLVRIDVDDPAYRTRSGVRVGMRQDEILAVYGEAMRVEPHPYTHPEGAYLVLQARDEPFGLIVETSGGRADSLRVGYWENVQWIEGCS